MAAEEGAPIDHLLYEDHCAPSHSVYLQARNGEARNEQLKQYYFSSIQELPTDDLLLPEVKRNKYEHCADIH